MRVNLLFLVSTKISPLSRFYNTHKKTYSPGQMTLNTHNVKQTNQLFCTYLYYITIFPFVNPKIELYFSKRSSIIKTPSATIAYSGSAGKWFRLNREASFQSNGKAFRSNRYDFSPCNTLFHCALDMSLDHTWLFGNAADRCFQAYCHGI